MRAFYFLISLVAARRVKKGLKNTETEHDYEFEGAGTGGTPDGIFGGGELTDLFMGDSYEEDDWYYPGVYQMVVAPRVKLKMGEI